VLHRAALRGTALHFAAQNEAGRPGLNVDALGCGASTGIVLALFSCAWWADGAEA
jgi:hypothetical protein